MKKARKCVGRGGEGGYHRIAPRMALHGNCRNESVLGSDQRDRFLPGLVDALEGLEILSLIFVLSPTLVRNDRPTLETLAHIVITMTTMRANKALARVLPRPSTSRVFTPGLGIGYTRPATSATCLAIRMTHSKVFCEWPWSISDGIKFPKHGGIPARSGTPPASCFDSFT